MKIFLSFALLLTSAILIAQTAPKPNMSFAVMNNAIAPEVGIAGKYAPGQQVYILDHANKIVFKTTTKEAKLVKEEFGSHQVTTLTGKPEPMYGMVSVVIDPAEGDVQFIQADTVKDAQAISDFAKLLKDSNAIAKKFKATIVDKDGMELKNAAELETRQMLENKSFSVLRFTSGDKTVEIAKFPNAVFFRIGNRIVYTPSLVDNYNIPAFSIGNRLFIDLLGYMVPDIKYPKCENWNSRVMEVTEKDIIQRGFACY